MPQNLQLGQQRTSEDNAARHWFVAKAKYL